MPTAGVHPWSRTLVAVALAAAALVASARPARASGCHADDRPAAGLTYTRNAADPSGDAAGSTAAVRRASGIVPLPCSGQTPASVGDDAPAPPAAAVSAGPLPDDPGRPGRPVEGPFPRSRPRTSRLERPPRA